MRIHITTIAPEAAAVEIMRHIKAHGGQWIVNSVEDEGYVMAQVGTLDGQRLERSFSPCLCGPFNASWSIRVMAADMKASRNVGASLKTSQSGSSRTRGRPALCGPPRGEEVLVIEALRAGSLAISPLAERVGLNRKRVADLLRKLRAREFVVVAGTEMAPGNFTERHVYAVAA